MYSMTLEPETLYSGLRSWWVCTDSMVPGRNQESVLYDLRSWGICTLWPIHTWFYYLIQNCERSSEIIKSLELAEHCLTLTWELRNYVLSDPLTWESWDRYTYFRAEELKILWFMTCKCKSELCELKSWEMCTLWLRSGTRVLSEPRTHGLCDVWP